MNKLSRFFKYGLKSVKREGFFAVVNVLGLSLGMFCFLITSLYVRDELMTDRWHSTSDRIYSPMSTIEMQGMGSVNMLPSYGFAQAIKEGVPGIESTVSLTMPKEQPYSYENERFKAVNFYTSEPSFFEVFDFELKYGNEGTALDDPKNLVISEAIANKHFGKSVNPVGQTLKLGTRGEHVITGVLARPLKNSHLKFDMIVPLNVLNPNDNEEREDWWFHGLHYILLREGYSAEQLLAETKKLTADHEKFKDKEYSYSKFTDMYLNGTTWVGRENIFGGNMKYIYIFSLVGILMLVVACFNYINLTTARAIGRAKDMVLRKIVGASRMQLIGLQVAETAFLSMLALLIASIGTELTLPAINNIIEKELSLNFAQDPGLLLIPGGLLLLVTLISGIYPSLVASSFNLSSLLKGSTPRSSGALFRKTLVVMQFLICGGLLSSALIIRGQANFLVNLDMGYNRTNVINIDLSKRDMSDKYEELKTEFSRIPQIEMISGSALPVINSIMIFPVENEGEKSQEMISFSKADKDILDFFDLELVAGKGFDELTDSELKTAILINESAVKKFGYEEPIGQRPLGPDGFKVVGVVKDFHFNSAKSQIQPMFFDYGLTQMSNLHVKFREGDRELVMAQMEAVWDKFNSVEPLEVSDMETFFAKDYRRETTLVSIFDLLTALLAFIAFLGLFALATLENKLKEKEMSVRKVLGASYLSLISTMNRRFVMLIVLALAASIPATWYLINGWLSDFPYRISNTGWQFAISGLGVLLLTVIVLSAHGYRNARRNPAEVLRNE